MGVCFSKSREASPSNKVPSKAPPKENGTVKEEIKQPELAVNKDSCIGEEKNWKKEAHVKNIAQHGDGGSETSAIFAGPLRASSCTKEEVDAILIQCGRLSRNSSGKASNEIAGSSVRKRRSGSKGSRDFEEDGKEMDKAESRASPSRRASSREHSGSRDRGSSGGRRVSRSPGRRLDGPASSASACDKLKQQPAKMVSVPATEKCSLFSNGVAEGAERLSAVQQPSRSSSPANGAEISNENVQSQSLSRRDPMAEIDENSLRNQNEISTSMFNRSREADEGVEKPTQTQIVRQAKKPEIVEEVENLSQKTLNRTRSRPSRRTFHDLDYNPELNPISNTTLQIEEIQNKKQQQQQQHQDAFLFPTCVSETCSILQTVTELNSWISEQRSYGTKIVTEPELEVKGSSTVRDVEPRESTGSNSSIRQPWTSPSNLNSADSSVRCYKQLLINGKEVDVEDEVQKRSWPEAGRGQRSRASSSGNSLTEATIKAATPLGKKKFNHSSLLQQVR